MKNNILISTTNSIENAEITQYMDIISAHIVVGTNIFSDFGASITDVIGGNSRIYQGKLENIYNQVINEIVHKAFKIGANAIIGLKVDFDEISGKGKSMFMVTAIGTPVKITKNDFIKKVEQSNSIEYVSSEELNKELFKMEIISILESRGILKQHHWDFLFLNPTNEIADLLLIYLSIYSKQYDSVLEANTVNNTMAYFNIIDSDYAINLIYADLSKRTDSKIKIINEAKLFSPLKIIELIDQNQYNIAIRCLEADKESYNKEDLDNMKIIVDKLDNIPQTGKLEASKGVFSSKGKQNFICENNHKNYDDTEFCETCHVNINGLVKEQIVIINKFKNRVKALESLIK